MRCVALRNGVEHCDCTSQPAARVRTCTRPSRARARRARGLGLAVGLGGLGLAVGLGLPLGGLGVAVGWNASDNGTGFFSHPPCAAESNTACRVGSVVVNQVCRVGLGLAQGQGEGQQPSLWCCSEQHGLPTKPPGRSSMASMLYDHSSSACEDRSDCGSGACEVMVAMAAAPCRTHGEWQHIVRV